MSRNRTEGWPRLVSWSSDETAVRASGQELALWGSQPDRSRRADVYCDFAVVGAGAAGLAAAVGAAESGARVLLIERGAAESNEVSGGLVEALRRAAQLVHSMKMASSFGLRASNVELDFEALMAQARRAEEHLTAAARERISHKGIELFAGNARFVDRDVLEAAGRRLRFGRALIATGAEPAIPAIEGLHEAGYLTANSVFSLTELPARLVVLGGGATGCELAQAFARLGSRVTLVEAGPRLLPDEDASAAQVVECVFAREGIRVLTGTELTRVQRLANGSRQVDCERGLDRLSEQCEQILIAIGLAPNVGGLGLETAGVEFDKYGVRVDDFLRTTNSRVFAAGRACSLGQSVQGAAALGTLALHNALFSRRRRASELAIPRCIQTDPQVAHVGLRERDAPDANVRTITLALAPEPSAGADVSSDGFARVYCRGRSGKIAGATLVASNAGERLAEVALALGANLTLKAIAATARPDPSQNEFWRRLAAEFVRQSQRPSLWARLQRRLFPVRQLPS